MTETNAEIILEVRGILSQVLPDVFRQRLPLLLNRDRQMPVRLLVTTETDQLAQELNRQGNLYRPARGEEPLRFTWKASGAFHAVVRQFRLDFLRHLGPEELRMPIYMGIYLYQDAMAMLDTGALQALQVSMDSAVRGEPVSVPPRAFSSTSSPSVPDPFESPLRTVPPRPAWAGGLRISREGELLRNPLQNEIIARHAEVPPPFAEAASILPGESTGPLARVIDAAREESMPAGEMDDDPTPVPSSGPVAGRSLPDAPDALDGESTIPPDQTNPQVMIAPPPKRPQPTSPVESGHLPLPGNLYQDWFGFGCMPFNNTPDPHFFFPTPKHQEALSRLIYAISERKGFVMISGEIGSGKSTLCRTLLSQLPRQVKTALITHTHIDARQLVRAIAEDLDIPIRGLDEYEVLQALNAYLIEQLAEGATVCIIIDEAQNLSPEALEEVRMISNLETNQEKLVQLILLGQPELREKIQLPGLKQLRQRISVQFHLEPLSYNETLSYIAHRLKIAGPTEPIDFRRGAMRAVFEYSGGVPRLINTLCDNALLTAYVRESRTIGAAYVREAARDLDLVAQTSGLSGFFRMW